jgi:stage III sporulation protein AG
MDWVNTREKILNFAKRYWYVLLVLVIGLGLMALPTEKQDRETTVSQPETQPQILQQELEQILSQIRGAGKVKVLLTELTGSQTVYQTDQDQRDEGSSNIKTVIIADKDRNQNGLVHRVDPPVYLGAVIVCQGGDSAAVKLAIVEAVASVTGLSTDRITVLKMK